MYKSVTAALSLAAAASIVPTAAVAQQGTGDDEEIVITATGQSSATSTTKTNTPIIESPQAISIISSEEMALRASPTIAHAERRSFPIP